MTETIKLELQYDTSEGKKRTLSITNPLPNLEEEQIKSVMEMISQQQIFKKDNSFLYETVNGARYVNRKVKEIF